MLQDSATACALSFHRTGDRVGPKNSETSDFLLADNSGPANIVDIGNVKNNRSFVDHTQNVSIQPFITQAIKLTVKREKTNQEKRNVFASAYVGEHLHLSLKDYWLGLAANN